MFRLLTNDIVISVCDGAINMAEDAARVKEALTYINDNVPKWTNDTLAKVFTKKEEL